MGSVIIDHQAAPGVELTGRLLELLALCGRPLFLGSAGGALDSAQLSQLSCGSPGNCRRQLQEQEQGSHTMAPGAVLQPLGPELDQHEIAMSGASEHVVRD